MNYLLLLSFHSKDKQLGQGDKSTVQRLFQRRETRLDKLQLLLEVTYIHIHIHELT